MHTKILSFMMGLFVLYPAYVFSAQEGCLPNQEGGLGGDIYDNQPVGGHWEWIGSENQNTGDFYSVSGNVAYLYHIANIPGKDECLKYIDMLNNVNPGGWFFREGECLTELTPGYSCCYHKPGADFIWVCDVQNPASNFGSPDQCLLLKKGLGP